MTPQTSLGQKIGLIGLGLLLSIFLLEASLRCGGFVFSFWQDHENKISASRQGAYRIMCIGESTTALGGGDSYPSQLETVLNERSKKMRFSVINEGVPGIDTTGIIRRLEKNLDRYHPQMVIAMMGVNDDDWNPAKTLAPQRDKGKLQGFFVSLRIYKLAKWIRSGISVKIKEPLSTGKSEKVAQSDFELAQSCQRLGRYEEVQNVLMKAMADRQLNYDETILLAWSYECQSRHPEAVEFFKKSLELDDKREAAYLGLGQAYFYMHEPSKAEEMLEKLLQIDPRRSQAYILLGQCYAMQGKHAEAEKTYLRAIAADQSGDDRAYGALGLLYEALGRVEPASSYFQKANTLRSQYVNLSTENNYQMLSKILEKRGVKLVCVQYPVRSVEQLKKIFQGEEGILFVSNEELFKARLKKEDYRDYFTDLFAGDFGHCTRKGNRLLAENIATVILKELSS